MDLPIVTAEKYIKYKQANGHLGSFIPPKIMMVCYQNSSLKHILEKYPDIKTSEAFSDVYFLNNGDIGVLGGWGFGASSLAVKLEQLIVLGVNKFIAVGTAGTLIDNHQIGDFVISPTALAEDGVSHHYMQKDKIFADAHPAMVEEWNEFLIGKSIPSFHSIPTWSFSAIFRETPAHIRRVKSLGCGVVEMEAATLYAMGVEKDVQTLSLFVVSDSMTEEEWIPHIKEPKVKNNLHKLVDWTLQFCNEQVK